MTNTSKVPIILRLYGGYFDQKGQVDAYERWLTLRGVEFTFMLEDAYSNIPYVVLMPPNDATAFKLRFGL